MLKPRSPLDPAQVSFFGSTRLAGVPGEREYDDTCLQT